MMEQLLTLLVQQVLGIQNAVQDGGSAIAEKSLWIIKSCMFYLLSMIFFSIGLLNALFEWCRQWELGNYSFTGNLLASSILVTLGTLALFVPLFFRNTKDSSFKSADKDSQSSPLVQAIERLAITLINRWSDDLEKPKQEQHQ